MKQQIESRRGMFAGGAALAAFFATSEAKASSSSSWLDEPYDASKFKAGAKADPNPDASSQWLVRPENISVYKYLMLQADTMLIDFAIIQSIVTGTPLVLMIKVPGGKYLTPHGSVVAVPWWENTYESAGIGWASADVRAVNFILIAKSPAHRPPPAQSNTWLPSSGTTPGTYVFGQMVLRVQDAPACTDITCGAHFPIVP